LRAAGLSVSTGVGGHGVVGVVEGAAGTGTGPTLAYRADLDAVAADETSGCEFASQVPGAAHLCGHDLHTAVGVGVARVLARLRNRFAGRVVLLFQPAEETLDGARAMIDAGVLDRTAPREIYAVHCGPQPVGVVTVTPGFGMPALDIGYIHVSGPDAGGNAERIGELVEELSTVKRPETPAELARFRDAMRAPDSPLARFVVTGAQVMHGNGQAEVKVWLRAWPPDRQAEVRSTVRWLVDSFTGARLEFPSATFPAMVSSAELSRDAAAYLRKVAGLSVRETAASYPFGCDDFALFLGRVPGAMLFLGVGDPVAELAGNPPRLPHSPAFTADERAIGLGVRAMTGLLLNRLAALS
jgi:metal-dependent amidase/aminoacylase/carboxypeptidase family protein